MAESWYISYDFLIKNGTSVNIRGHNEQTILHDKFYGAIWINIILEACIDPHIADYTGRSSLHYAAFTIWTRIFEFYLKQVPTLTLPRMMEDHHIDLVEILTNNNHRT